MSARRQNSRRTGQGSFGHRTQHADRLLGLSRLEGYAGGCAFHRPSEGLLARARRSRSLHAAGRGQWINACRRQRSRGIESAIDVTKKSDACHVGADRDDADRQADQHFGRGIGQAGPAATHGEVWICSVTKAVPISIGRGENRGRQVTYHNVVRNLLKVGDWNGNIRAAGRCRWKIFPARASMPRWSMSRAAIATSPARCSGRRIRSAALKFAIAHAQSAQSPMHRQIKRKRTNSRWSRSGLLVWNRPDPDGPGGLGAEESGTERTGPTHGIYFHNSARQALGRTGAAL